MAKHAVSSEPSVFEGEVYPTTESGDLIITKYVKAKEVHVRFVDTGYRTITQAVTIKRGLVRDRSIKRIAGVGFAPAGDVKYKQGTVTHKAYSAWNSMIRRCYQDTSMHYRFYGAKGVTVDESWHNFQTFAEWFIPRYKEGFQLDKDLLGGGLKIYSPDTCCLLPAELNSLIAPRTENSKYMRGVSKEGKKFSAKVYHAGKIFYRKSFYTEQAAADAYTREKSKVIRERAKHHLDLDNIDVVIYEALVNWKPL